MDPAESPSEGSESVENIIYKFSPGLMTILSSIVAAFMECVSIWMEHIEWSICALMVMAYGMAFIEIKATKQVKK